MPLSNDEIQDRMQYHPPSPVGIWRHRALTLEIGNAMRCVEDVCPDGREKSIALAKLKEAKMWASAAVARNPVTR